MRERHTTTALAAASAHSEDAFAALLGSDDNHTLGRAREAATTPARRAQLRAHPSTRIQALWWASELESAGVRTLRRRAEGAGGVLDVRGVSALMRVARVADPRWVEWVLTGLLEREHEDWEALLDLVDEEVEDWEMSARVLVAALAAPLGATEELARCQRVLRISQWRGFAGLAVGVSRDPWVWTRCALEDTEAVLVLRRLCTDELVADVLAGRSPCADLTSTQWGALSQTAGDVTVLAASEGEVTGVVEEALRQSILAAASRGGCLTELTGLARARGVDLGSCSVRESGRALAHLTSLLAHRDASWSPGEVSDEVTDALANQRAPWSGELGDIWARTQASVHAGGGIEEVLADLVGLAVRCEANTSLDEECGVGVGEALAKVCVDLRVPADALGAVLVHVPADDLDTEAETLERSAAGDERFAHLAAHVPYICDDSDLSVRARPAGVARMILRVLTDPGFTPLGMSHSEESLTEWRDNAVVTCADRVSLRPAEVGALPAAGPGGRSTEAVGRHLATHLHGRQWEVLAGISDTFEGSVGRLVEAVQACG